MVVRVRLWKHRLFVGDAISDERSFRFEKVVNVRVKRLIVVTEMHLRRTVVHLVWTTN